MWKIHCGGAYPRSPPLKGTCGKHAVHPQSCLETRQMKLSARKLRFPFTFPQLQSCLWEAPGIIYNWKNKRSHLQTPVSIGLKSFWKPKATAPFGIPREYEQQIKRIQRGRKKGHCRARTNFLVTFSHCHNFPFSVISRNHRTWIHNSYLCFKSPPLREPGRNTDTFVSKNFQLQGKHRGRVLSPTIRRLHTWFIGVAGSHDLLIPSEHSRDMATPSRAATISIDLFTQLPPNFCTIYLAREAQRGLGDTNKSMLQALCVGNWGIPGQATRSRRQKHKDTECNTVSWNSEYQPSMVDQRSRPNSALIILSMSWLMLQKHF